jgi:isopenicillin-N N-acyltransferase-like protein
MSGQTFPLIEVSGDSFEMGYQHGAQAGDLIRRYVLWIERRTRTPKDVLFRKAAAYLPLIETVSSALVQEIRGLAEGAEIPFQEALLCQVRGYAARAPNEACSSFALKGSVTADGQPLAGQNIDLEPEFADVAILLRVRPLDGRPAALMCTMAGQLGYQGMNEHGVAHFANGLFDYEWRLGVPHYVLKRVMLEKRDVSECLDVLVRHRTCSAGNVVLCDREGHIADVEFRPEGTALVQSQDPDVLLHTNHYLAQEFAAKETFSVADSRARLARMRTLISEHRGLITVDVVKNILADHDGDPFGICRHGGREAGKRLSGFRSIVGLIAEPSQGRLHVRRGHGCLGTWQTYAV